MKTPSDPSTDWDDLRARIIGLGERSTRKSYYPELEQRLVELERFRALLDQSNDLIFLVQIPSGRFFDVNDSACRQLGLSREMILGMSIGNLVPKSVSENMAALFNDEDRMDPGGKTIVTAFRSNSREMPVEISVRLVSFKDANYAVIVARDITERKQAEEDRQAHLWFFESLDRINRAMQRTNDLEQVMKDVLDTLLSVFDCDRAWLVYPCDPDSSTWQVPMERTRPEYPGVLPVGVELPLDPVGAAVYRILRNSDGPVKFGAGEEHPVPMEMSAAFNVQSFIALAFYPKVGKPWSFGLHQCSYARVWTLEEERLFKEVGRRLSDALSSLLAFRNLQESEQQIKHLIDASPVAMLVSSGADEHIEWVNDKFIELFGFTVEDMPDVAHWWPLAYPDEAYQAKIKAEWEKYTEHAMREKSQITPMEATVKCKDGSYRYVEFRLSSIGEKHLVTFVDLTEHKQAAEKLLANEQLFRALVEKSPDFIARYDREFRRIYVNPAIQKLFGVPAENVLGKTPSEHSPVYAPQIYIDHLRHVIDTTTESAVEIPFRTVEGEMHWGHIRFVPELGPNGTVDSVLAIGRDIHEIKENERSFSMLAENFPDFVMRFDRDGHYLYVNPAIENAFDLPAASIIGKTLLELPQAIKLEQREMVVALIQDVCDNGIASEAELHWEEQSNERILETRYVPEKDPTGNVVTVLCIARDVTIRKRAEADIQALAKFPGENPNPVMRVAKDGILLYANPASTELARYWNCSVGEQLPENWWKLAQETLRTGSARETEIYFDGRIFSFIFAPIVESGYVNLYGIDITKRKRAEDALRASENRFRVLSENAFVGIYIIQDGLLNYVNSTLAKIFGYMPEELTGAPPAIVIHPDDQAMVSENIRLRIVGEVETVHYEFRGQCKNGEIKNIDVLGGRFDLGGKMAIIGNLMDITERKHHELEREAIITVSTALRQATTSEDILNVILDQLIELFKADGAVLVLPNPQTGGLTDEMGRGPIGERMVGLNIPPEMGVSNWVIKNKKPYLNNHAEQDSLFYRPDLLGDSHCLAAVPLIAQEKPIGALWIARQTDIMKEELRLLNAIADIAANAIHRVMLHEQTVQQLHHLIALHQIDLAISANFDLNVTLNVILKNVKDELKVDATSILLLDAVTHTLDYAAGIGFRTRHIEHSHVKLGNGCAGRAAQEYRTISYPDLNQSPGAFSRSALLAGDEFLSHYATPLIMKGQVKGVLEIFHRKTFDAEPEWLNYFETLATQAAIAIESASLFENLHRSNLELMLAYDATIEGWSRALDLRDRETEGHTQRVTEMVLGLAEKMGMSDSEKMDLKRGALLHDIGKMGVPDSILNKPGDLTDDEWEIMRQHPVYAYQMLSPIAYLKRALDVPYCHHEKWDGSGYPRGLKRDTIPLSARMFAVVDVFDALTSNRPYRTAWTQEKVFDYIREQSGKYFDPKVVEVFLDGR